MRRQWFSLHISVHSVNSKCKGLLKTLHLLAEERKNNVDFTAKNFIKNRSGSKFLGLFFTLRVVLLPQSQNNTKNSSRIIPGVLNTKNKRLKRCIQLWLCLRFRMETNFKRLVVYNLVWGILRNQKNFGDSLVHVRKALDPPFGGDFGNQK